MIRRQHEILFAVILSAAFSGAAWSAPPRLDLPIRCEPGRTCYVQNYFDHDAGPGWRDYACGRLSYNGHHGTDFRLLDLAQMNAGVPVVAAAEGNVAAVRDGEPDEYVSRRGKAALNGRDAGNGVRIDHGDGWETQYSHMRRGSVAVKPGQHVRSGDVLGLVGLSGNTEFPHVDLEVRKDGKPLDPFSPGADSECGAPVSPLWSASALAALRYRATGLLIAGFSNTLPTRDKAEAGVYTGTILDAKSEIIAFWAELFGVRAGDRELLEIKGPAGEVLTRADNKLPGDKALWFTIVGKRRADGNWPPGHYTAQYTLERSGAPVIEEAREILVQ